MSRPTPAERLSCGRPTEDLLVQVADGRGTERDDHQRGCPHCQAALTEYDRLWSPIRELGAEAVTAPEGFLEDALHRIRGSVEHTHFGVLPSPTGLTRISARVVMITAREGAQAVRGVRIALGRHVAAAVDGGAEVTIGVAGRSTAIEITLAADHGADLRELGDRVRAAVVTSVRTLTGLEPVHVDVIIDDVLP